MWVAVQPLLRITHMMGGGYGPVKSDTLGALRAGPLCELVVGFAEGVEGGL